jgi:YVTN family beta-propeller protein
MTSFAGTELQRGAELAGYRIEALLGRGGMGVVYLAEQLRLKRRVALKLLAPELAADARFRERFLGESELAASLDHPNVVPIFDAGEADGLLYIAMRYVEGTDLGTLLAQEGPLQPERAVAIVGAVAAGLDAAHARGLVHRDVKPANVLLAQDGHVYLADFGLTRSAQEGVPEEKPHLSGTLEYLAPEQIEGDPPDPSADLYSLGCVLYHTLAGQPPYAKRTQMELLWAHFNEDPPSLHAQRPELPEAIDPVIATALAKEPAERYQSGHELATATAQALGVGLPTPRMSRRKLLLLASLGALLIAIAAAVPSILLTRGDTNPAKPTTTIARDTLQRIDPNTDKLVATIPYGQAGVEATTAGEFSSGALAVGEGGAWVFGPRLQTVLRIDPKTNAIAGQSAVSLDPEADAAPGTLVAKWGHVWAITGPSEVTVIDPETTIRTGQVTIPGLDVCTYLAPAYDTVWVWCNDGTHTSAWRIDPSTEKAVRTVEYGETFEFSPQSGARPGERLWLSVSLEDGTVFGVYDLATADLLAEFRLPFYIAGFAARESGPDYPSPDGNTSAWVSNSDGDSVWQLDPLRNRVARKIRVGRDPTGVALSDGAVWVANSGDGTVSRIDPASGRVVETIEVGGSPQSIAVGEGGVWVTVYPTPTAAASNEASPPVQPTSVQAGATPISLTTALTFDDPLGSDCTRERPCTDHGTFAAADESTTALLCPEGTMAELFHIPKSSEDIAIAERTLICRDGSTLVMHVRRSGAQPLTPTTAAIAETWTVTQGTGRFTDLKGDGTMEAIYDESVTPPTLGGTLTGNLG